MRCPKCKQVDLKATRLETGLPAAGCAECQGALVTLLYYRDWADNNDNNTVEFVPSREITEDVGDSGVAMTCPKCGRLMIRYRIDGKVNNCVDVCSSCDEAWLDGGEWELLKALQLADKMPLIFTEAWQRKVRKDVSDSKRRTILAKSIGEDGVNRVEAFKEWLDTVSHKSDVLLFLAKE